MIKKLPDKQIQTALDDEQLEWCIEAKMSDGLSREAAERECKEIQREGREYAEQGPKFPASDSHLGIVGREATPLEKCMGLRIDIYGEDEETARRTCSRMFNEPLVKNKMGLAVFEEGDPETMALAFHNWDLKYSSEWAWNRERENQEKTARQKAIDNIIKELKSDSNSEDRFLPDISLREKAERIYDIRKGESLAKMQQAKREDRLTVGDLFGKNKAQILVAQRGDQRDYGKTRAEILEEIKVQTAAEERLKKLRRGDRRE